MKNYVLALILGSLLTLGFAPYNYLLAPVLALMGFFYLLQKEEKLFLLGFCFGLGNFSTGVYWVYISLYRFGNAPLAFAISANILLILYLSLYPAFLGYFLTKFSQPQSLKRAALIPLFWATAELIRAYLITGFPWLSLAYSQLNSPLSAYAPIFGVFGVGFLLSLALSFVVFVLISQKWQFLLIPALICGLAYPLKSLEFTQPSGKNLTIALIQANTSPLNKFDMEQIQRDIGVNLLLSENRTEDLIIWSETSIALMENQALSLISQLDREFKNKKQGLIFGIPTGDLEGDYFNSVLAVGQAEGRYSKEHLLPFGEYIPLKSIFSIFSKFVDMPLGGFARGDKKQKPILIKGVPAGSSICFEGAFGRVLRRSIPEAQFLINVSNDGWFSGSNASFQHLEMQQFRALELGRELARATTDGISAFINHKGELKAKTNNGEKIVLSGEIQPREGITPYARFGNLLIILLLAIYIVLLTAFFIHSKKKRP